MTTIEMVRVGLTPPTKTTTVSAVRVNSNADSREWRLGTFLRCPTSPEIWMVQSQ